MPAFQAFGMRVKRLVLELELGADPISGRIHDEHCGVVRPFTGWLGLIAAVQSLGVPESEAAEGEPVSA
jgi:hypothetical protein